MKPNWTYKYSPNPAFMHELKSYDSQLDVFWDALSNDWVMVRKGQLSYHEIGHYKILDNRTLESLYEGDLWRSRNSKEFNQYIANHNGKIKDEIKRKSREKVEEAASKMYVDNLREHKTQFSTSGL